MTEVARRWGWGQLLLLRPSGNQAIIFLQACPRRTGLESCLEGCMHTIRRTSAVAAAALAASVLLSGCLIPPSPRAVAKAITHAPPPPRLEVHKPPRPGTMHVWVDGRWDWNGTKWVWRAGTWQQPPQRQKTWVPGHWSHTKAGHIYVPGHWK